MDCQIQDNFLVPSKIQHKLQCAPTDVVVILIETTKGPAKLAVTRGVIPAEDERFLLETSPKDNGWAVEHGKELVGCQL